MNTLLGTSRSSPSQDPWTECGCLSYRRGNASAKLLQNLDRLRRNEPGQVRLTRFLLHGAVSSMIRVIAGTTARSALQRTALRAVSTDGASRRLNGRRFAPSQRAALRAALRFALPSGQLQNMTNLCKFSDIGCMSTVMEATPAATTSGHAWSPELRSSQNLAHN